MNCEEKIHVASIKIIEKDCASKIYKPLAKALAPLGLYLTPLIQEANYLNKVKFHNKMQIKDFLDMLENLKLLNETIFVKYNKKTIDVYTTKIIFLNSVYSDEDFIKKIYKNNNLPIQFE